MVLWPDGEWKQPAIYPVAGRFYAGVFYRERRDAFRYRYRPADRFYPGKYSRYEAYHPRIHACSKRYR